MPARLGIPVFNTSLAKSTAPPDQAGRETHSLLECRRFNGFDNLQKLALEWTMQFRILFQDGAINSPLALVGGIDVLGFHLN
jgi:hypothetical protein